MSFSFIQLCGSNGWYHDGGQTPFVGTIMARRYPSPLMCLTNLITPGTATRCAIICLIVCPTMSFDSPPAQVTPNGGPVRPPRRRARASIECLRSVYKARQDSPKARGTPREQYLARLAHNAQVSIHASMNPNHNCVCPVPRCRKPCNRNGLLCHM